MFRVLGNGASFQEMCKQSRKTLITKLLILNPIMPIYLLISLLAFTLCRDG